MRISSGICGKGTCEVCDAEVGRKLWSCRTANSGLIYGEDDDDEPGSSTGGAPCGELESCNVLSKPFVVETPLLALDSALLFVECVRPDVYVCVCDVSGEYVGTLFFSTLGTMASSSYKQGRNL